MNRSYNIKFEIFLKEQDTSKEIGGSSKAIFITGGPGSGKDLYIRNLIEKYNLIEMIFRVDPLENTFTFYCIFLRNWYFCYSWKI